MNSIKVKFTYEIDQFNHFKMVATLIIILLSVLRYNFVLGKADKLAFKTVIYVNINSMKDVFILELSSKSFQNGKPHKHMFIVLTILRLRNNFMR